MRITHVNKYYPPHLGGIEFHLRDIAEGFAARGDEVRVIVSNDCRQRAEEDINGVHVTRLPRLFERASTPVVPTMAGEIRAETRRAEPPDILHMHFPYPWGEVAWLRAKPDVPTVVMYHSDIVRQKAGLAAYRPMLERFLDRVDIIIASSPDMVRHSEFLAPRSGKCRVVPFGIHVSDFAPTPGIERRAQQLREGHERPIVLFVGRLIYYKGVDVLVRAMAEVDADLVIVGTGELEGTLRVEAAARGILDRITFVPPVDFDELRAWYRAADVFCLPSVARSEAFGLVQLEAHASGTPVVSTRLTTGVPFVNPDGVTGLTVPPGDASALAAALRTLVEDSALRERLGAQALERAKAEFSIGRMIADTEKVYAEATALHAEKASRAGGRRRT